MLSAPADGMGPVRLQRSAVAPVRRSRAVIASAAIGVRITWGWLRSTVPLGWLDHMVPPQVCGLRSCFADVFASADAHGERRGADLRPVRRISSPVVEVADEEAVTGIEVVLLKQFRVPL
jgi:hypothetical protein